MLTRKVTDSLLRWEASRGHKALFITGARQVGKTTAIRAFAKKRYRSFAELNFLQDPRAREIFSGSLNANTIVSNLTAFLRMPLEPGSTLVLLDEIQECPLARTAIKFLVEDGRFDYVETGSLPGVRARERYRPIQWGLRSGFGCIRWTLRSSVGPVGSRRRPSQR
mgnify:CR=1 FL=1